MGQAQVSSTIPPQLTVDMVLATQPEQILGLRSSTPNTEEATEVLVKWHDLPDYEATWESVPLLPDFQTSTLRTSCLIGPAVLQYC